MLVRADRAADPRKTEAENARCGGLSERQFGGSNLKKGDGEAHDQEPGPDRAKDGYMPRRMMIKRVAGDEERDAHGSQDATHAGGAEEASGTASAQLNIVLDC